MEVYSLTEFENFLYAGTNASYDDDCQEVQEVETLGGASFDHFFSCIRLFHNFQVIQLFEQIINDILLNFISSSSP